MTLVIMAAGMGSRYGGIKQIDPMGPSGEIILDYSVRDAVKAGFDRVVFIIRKDIEKAFRETVGNRFTGKVDVEYAFQELDDLPAGFTVPTQREKPWGTGQAILACRDIIDESFIVINADDFYGAEAFIEGAKGLKSVDPAKLDGFLVSYRLSNTLSPHGYVTRGVCEEQNGLLSCVTERFKIGSNADGVVEYQEEDGSHPMTGEELASMNFWGFSPAIFPELERRFIEFLKENGHGMKTEYLIPSEVDALISSGKMSVKVLKTEASWFGVTYPEDKPSVKATLKSLVEQGIYPSPLW
ncbi:MAG: sugar phosphate nucleotidyltransferase [Spirochaetaceae bacterium]|nr:sugar phosphate nucleotidyltransferase [Spirochaetaceae bacterium]